MSTTPIEPVAAGPPRRRAPGALRGRAIALGDAGEFFWHVTRGVISGRVREYFVEILRQANVLATGSTVVVIAMVFSFGLWSGVQASYGARLVGAPAAAGAFTAVGDLREIVPLAFAYMMAAKVSTGYVAEIGTMRIKDEIDAMDVMGLNSMVYLCSTRLLATWLFLPLVYGMAIVAAFIAAFIAVVLQIGQASAGGYLELFWKFQSTSDFAFSGAKGVLMGTFVVLVGVYYGYRVRGGPVEVGRATARSMVVNLVGIHVIAILTTQLFWGGAPRLPIGG
jgi:phospholipid/cholesterol/gamma-HCH transport system permease protein